MQIDIVKVSHPLLPNPIYREIVPDCFKIKFSPTEREQKRQFDREVSKCIESLMEVEMGFIGCIFDPNVENFKESYEEIYKAYNAEYLKRANHLLKNGKFKYITPDMGYFKREFQPNL